MLIFIMCVSLLWSHQLNFFAFVLVAQIWFATYDTREVLLFSRYATLFLLLELWMLHLCCLSWMPILFGMMTGNLPPLHSNFTWLSLINISGYLIFEPFCNLKFEANLFFYPVFTILYDYKIHSSLVAVSLCRN